MNVFGQKSGAKGVNVELQSDTQGVRSTMSDANGVFYFTPVIPGPYTIKVNRDRWHFAQSAHKVIVETGNTELPDDYFIVDGFDVFGRLLNAGQSQSNIGVALYAQKSVTETFYSNLWGQKFKFVFDPLLHSKPFCRIVQRTVQMFHNLTQTTNKMYPVTQWSIQMGCTDLVPYRRVVICSKRMSKTRLFNCTSNRIPLSLL